MGEDFIKYANSFQTVISLGLGRISALLDIMGNPQDSLRCIHVGGTNGKGSVCAFLESMLISAGYSVGKYISPNLVKVNERISVNGVQISDRELNPLLEKIGGLVPKVEAITGEKPSQFEVWTAAAFDYFAGRSCDYVILEVGLGGEFDATNVIKTNAAAVITRVALDHCAMLGSTVREIAMTKCGIIKENSPTVTIAQDKDVNRVIATKAEEKHSSLTVVSAPESIGFEGIKEKFIYDGEEVLCGLGGPHQLENAAVAAQTARLLGIDRESIIKGIETARNPARLEELAPGLIFDGAHNPNGVQALVRALERYFPSGEQTVIFACMRDKDILPSLRLLNSPRRKFIFTCVEGNSRSMTASELKDTAASAGIDGELRPNLQSAVELAAKIGRPTVICGSLYLYETVQKAVEEWKKINA